ncbi:MAG: hypothetical protein KAU23_06315, partial [Anaerolineales bacterium]|nr:hypothetical protein [Anaerolineales bacterium]
MPKPKKASTLPVSVPHPLNLNEAAESVAGYIGRGDTSIFDPVQTGFPVLDQLLGGSEDMQGGFYPEDLWLLAGAQGIGKTSLALQMAHNMGSQEVLALFVCYEHTPITLWERLICQASGSINMKGQGGKDNNLVGISDLRKIYRSMIEDYEGQDFSQEKLIDEILSHLPAPKKLWAQFTKSAA